MSTTQPRLTTWTAAKADTYRQQHSEAVQVFHLLIDQSPSMYEYRRTVIACVNRHLRWLQTHASPMSVGHLILFDECVEASPVTGLHQLPPLTERTYDPSRPDGTALYNAMGAALATHQTSGTHTLLCLSDGEDCARAPRWTAERVCDTFADLQRYHGWCGVFLGVDQDALGVGQALGFPATHCLPITGDGIAQALRKVQQALQRYLSAPVPARKLLAAGGPFT